MARGPALFAALAALIAAAGAAPRPDPAAAVLGAWRFQTEPYASGCVMTGDLVVMRDANRKGFTCRLVAHEACPEIKITAQQVCTLAHAHGAITITSTIEHVTSPNYAPDNFALKLESASRMSGELRSADIAPVVFWRGPGATS